MLCISNHTACRFTKKRDFFRSLRAGRRCDAASRFNFFNGETLQTIARASIRLKKRAGEGMGRKVDSTPEPSYLYGQRHLPHSGKKGLRYAPLLC